MEDTKPDLPDSFVLKGKKVRQFKGENGPQTPAALYLVDPDNPLSWGGEGFEQVEGADPSYNNLTDMDCALQTMSHLMAGFKVNFGETPAISLGVKHGNACGAGYGDDAAETLRRMVTGDHEAIFGGTMLTNFEVGNSLAQVVREYDLWKGEKRRILDVTLSPAFSPGAIETLKRKDGACRMFQSPALLDPAIDVGLRIRTICGSFMVEPNYEFVLDLNHPEAEFYGPELTEQQRRDLIFAWGICATSNSNTITLGRNGMLIANGVGQQKRNRAAWLAVEIAKQNGHSTQGCVASSDSFFPFFDAVEILIAAGVSVVFATKAGLRAQEIIDGCIAAGISLVMLPDSLARGFYKH